MILSCVMVFSSISFSGSAKSAVAQEKPDLVTARRCLSLVIGLDAGPDMLGYIPNEARVGAVIIKAAGTVLPSFKDVTLGDVLAVSTRDGDSVLAQLKKRDLPRNFADRVCNEVLGHQLGRSLMNTSCLLRFIRSKSGNSYLSLQPNGGRLGDYVSFAFSSTGKLTAVDSHDSAGD